MDSYGIIRDLKQRISVTRQKVTIGKKYILDTRNFNSYSDTMIMGFLERMDARMPETLYIKQSESVEKLIDSLSWRLAICQSIWELVGLSKILPASKAYSGEIGKIGCSTEVPSSGSSSYSSIDLSTLSILVPSELALPPSTIYSGEKQPLCDADLYLQEIDIPDMESEIAESLREAVRCFRYDLYTACLAMLGKASEGAWIELGQSLAGLLSDEKKSENKKDLFCDHYVGIGKKINEVVKLYENHNMRQEIQNKSGVKVTELKSAVIWSDSVRESRNSVHYGAEPSMTNSYEKVAALLIGTVPHFKILYRLRNAVNQIIEECCE